MNIFGKTEAEKARDERLEEVRAKAAETTERLYLIPHSSQTERNIFEKRAAHTRQALRNVRSCLRSQTRVWEASLEMTTSQEQLQDAEANTELLLRNLSRT